MTTTATTRRAGPYAGNGGAVSFAFAFKVFAATDIVVRLKSAAGALSTQVLTTNYTVTINPDQTVSPGGTITMVVAPPTGSLLSILGNTALDQPIALPGAGSFDPVTIEQQLDRVAFQVQQLQAQLDAVLRAPAGETLLDLPPALTRRGGGAGTLLGFDSTTGESLLYSPESALANVVSTPFTPGLEFNNAAVGMTGTFSGRYARVGNIATVDVAIILTNKGSSVGTARIKGLPFAPNVNSPTVRIFGTFFGMNSVASGFILCLSHNAGEGAQLAVSSYEVNGASGGVADQDASRFTNSSEIRFTYTYQV